MVVTANQSAGSPGDHVAARSSTLPSLMSPLFSIAARSKEEVRPLAFSKGGGQNRTPPLERYALGVSKG
jgi:hypothetical protein